MSKMKIYGFFNSRDPYHDGPAVAIAADGTVVAEHFCSCEGWAVHDLGMRADCNWKHDRYDATYPDGWETEFVLNKDIETHAGLQEAFRLARLAVEGKEGTA